MSQHHEIDSSLTKRLYFLLGMSLFLIIPFGGTSALFGAMTHIIYKYEISFTGGGAAIDAEIIDFDQTENCYRKASGSRECTRIHIVRFQYTDESGITQTDKRTVYYSLWQYLQKNPSTAQIEFNTPLNYPAILNPIVSFFDIDAKNKILRVSGENEMGVVYFCAAISLVTGIFVLWMLIYTLRATFSETYYRKQMIEQNKETYR